MSVIQRAAEHMRENGAAAERGALHDARIARPTSEPPPPRLAELPAPAARPVRIADPERDAGPRFSVDFEALGRQGYITPASRQSRLAEEIRLLKRRLIQRLRPVTDGGAMVAGGPRVILITSSRPEEGKSFIALNLALSFILDESQEILLIDAGSARPDVLRALGADTVQGANGQGPAPGLTDLLGDPGLDLSRALRRDPERRLSILPAGTPVASATSLFAGDRMRSLLAEIGRRHPDGIVLIDAPSLLARTEPLALARHADQVVFVVAASQTPRHVVATALDLLPDKDKVGLILNRMINSGSHNRFGDYYDACGKEK